MFGVFGDVIQIDNYDFLLKLNSIMDIYHLGN